MEPGDIVIGEGGARALRASVASLTSALTSMTHLGLYSVTLFCNLPIKVYKVRMPSGSWCSPYPSRRRVVGGRRTTQHAVLNQKLHQEAALAA